MNFCNNLAIHVLLKQISDEGNTNVVTSPLSLNAVLNMVAAGSKGRTLAQLLDALEAKSIDELNLKSSETMALVVPDNTGKGGGPILSIVNGVWADLRFPLKPSFEEVVQKYYKADTRTVDFIYEAQQVVEEVNLWIENGTKGLIKKLLRFIPPGVMIILANALYFKGAWKNAFEKFRTRDEDFHLLNGEKIKVPFMTSETNECHFYGSFDGFKLLKLPYRCADDRDEASFKNPFKTSNLNQQHYFSHLFGASKPNEHHDYNPFIASKLNEKHVFSFSDSKPNLQHPFSNPFMSSKPNVGHAYNPFTASKMNDQQAYNSCMDSKPNQQHYFSNPFMASNTNEQHYCNSPFMANKTNEQNYNSPFNMASNTNAQHCNSPPFMASQINDQDMYDATDDFKDHKVPQQQYGDDHNEDKRRFSMYVFLPDERNGLETLLQKFNSEPWLLHQQCDKLGEVKLDKMWLPKFKFSYTFSPSGTMKELGINLPFMPVGELTEMVDSADSDKVFISDIIQKACIEVNEEGTEAAAATIVMCFGGSMMRPPPPPSFVADHPFLFMIKEEVSGNVFFTGAVVNPLLAGSD